MKLVEHVVRTRIRCPECGRVQRAFILKTVIDETWIRANWDTYFHECRKCQHIILESEWDEVNNEESKTKANS